MMNLLYSPSYLQMATKGQADVKVEQMYRGTRHESKTEVGLVDLSASDVEILEEGGSLGGENIVIEEGYKDKQARRKKGSQGVDLTVARPTFFVSWRLIRRKFVLQRFILTTVH